MLRFVLGRCRIICMCKTSCILVILGLVMKVCRVGKHGWKRVVEKSDV